MASQCSRHIRNSYRFCALVNSGEPQTEANVMFMQRRIVMCRSANPDEAKHI